MRWLFTDVRVIISVFEMVINCAKLNLILPVAAPSKFKIVNNLFNTGKQHGAKYMCVCILTHTLLWKVKLWLLYETL